MIRSQLMVTFLLQSVSYELNDNNNWRYTYFWEYYLLLGFFFQSICRFSSHIVCGVCVQKGK